MRYTGEFAVYEEIIQEMALVYQHDKRPWMIGFSGGKDSTLLCCLVMEMLQRLAPEKRNKTVYIVSSDTMVENPIVRDYMHRMSAMINEVGAELNVKADIIYPKVEDSFWCKVIGLGYPTPEPPGFRWCTERLKINPMNAYTLNTIKNNGEVVLLLGVRKAESTYRANNIRAREIEGKLLVPHKDIENAYVYNPLTEIPNEEVWKFLLKGDAKSPWGSDNKYLFSLYQGENLGEEKSVIGEIDKDKIPVTGNSRFGCWICTIVKEDKSLKAFIDRGETWLIPLRDYRNWMLQMRSTQGAREYKRRNGAMYRKPDGTLGEGPFTMATRQEMLRRLLQLELDTGLSLITMEELKQIDLMWDNEGDLTRRSLVNLYKEITGQTLPWDQYKAPVFPAEVIDEIHALCEECDVEFELISKLIIEIEANKYYTKGSMVTKAFDRIINQGWLHFDSIEKGLQNEN
ncbi:MAG: DNA phosphorothioation system sulfurtransferase DndC [Clostridia bacterium]|nr:DNA phosphorothioation system sulfurtransferase DndC [Clostridia bacterium]